VILQGNSLAGGKRTTTSKCELGTRSISTCLTHHADSVEIRTSEALRRRLNPWFAPSARILDWDLTRCKYSWFLDACPESATGIRNRALIDILYRTGLRISEAGNLYPKGDVDLERGAMRVLNGKGGKSRIVSVDRGALAVLAGGSIFAPVAATTRHGRSSAPPRASGSRPATSAAGCHYSADAPASPSESTPTVCGTRTLPNCARKAWTSGSSPSNWGTRRSRPQPTTSITSRRGR
jgi:hypothetical protein